jgi:hypothetical protein
MKKFYLVLIVPFLFSGVVRAEDGGTMVYVPGYSPREMVRSPYGNGQYITRGRLQEINEENAAKAQAAAQASSADQDSANRQAGAMAQIYNDHLKKDRLPQGRRLKELETEVEVKREELRQLEASMKRANPYGDFYNAEDFHRRTELRKEVAQLGRNIKALKVALKDHPNYPAKATDYQPASESAQLPARIQKMAAQGALAQSVPQVSRAAKPAAQPAIAAGTLPSDLKGLNHCQARMIPHAKVPYPTHWGAARPEDALQYALAEQSNRPDEYIACNFPPGRKRIERLGAHYFAVQPNGLGYKIYLNPKLNERGVSAGVQACASSRMPCHSPIVSPELLADMRTMFPNEELMLREKLAFRKREQEPTLAGAFARMDLLEDWMTQNNLRLLPLNSAPRVRPTDHVAAAGE